MLSFEHDSDPLVSSPSISGWKKSTWTLWFCLSFLLNADKGIFPLALREADFASIAWQSAIPYAVGVAAGLCVAGWLFHTKPAKAVLAGSLLANASAFCLLSIHPYPRLCGTLRACNGFVAAVVLLYIPLWAEEFSPPSAQSGWMVMFAFVGPALGVLAGFILTSALQLQMTALILAAALVLCALKIFASSSIALHVPTLDKAGFNLPRLDSWSSPTVQIRQWWDDETRSSKTVLVLLGLVHGAGAPLLLYAPKVFGWDMLTCSIVALSPFLGAPVGAYACKSLGGYKPGNAYRALKTLWIILSMGLVLSVLLVVSAVVEALQPITLGLLLLSLGAALPCAAGVLMTGCPSYHRPASSFVSAFVYQVAGYAVAPCIFSLIATSMDDKVGIHAMAAHVFTSLGVAAFLATYCYASFPKVAVPLGLSGIDIQKDEIEFEVSRKRLLVSL